MTMSLPRHQPRIAESFARRPTLDQCRSRLRADQWDRECERLRRGEIPLDGTVATPVESPNTLAPSGG